MKTIQTTMHINADVVDNFKARMLTEIQSVSKSLGDISKSLIASQRFEARSTGAQYSLSRRLDMVKDNLVNRMDSNHCQVTRRLDTLSSQLSVALKSILQSSTGQAVDTKGKETRRREEEAKRKERRRDDRH